MPSDLVDYHVQNHVARIVMQRPDKRNAQSRLLLEAMDEAFAEAAGDPSVHVIALFGAGDHFSGGHDLGSDEELADRKQRPLQAGLRGRYQHSREHFVDKTLRWRDVPKPTICGVQGYAIFAGWMIASAMDIIYAADNAMFLSANFQYFSVPWEVNPRRAKEMLFESRFIDAQEAYALGLVNRVVALEALEEAVLEYAERIAQNDPFQLSMMKKAVNQMQDGQGFQAHITAAHHMHMLSSEGERDPDYALRVPDGKQRPMVAKAFENYRRRKALEDPSAS